MRNLILFLFLALSACSTSSSKPKDTINPQARKLLDSGANEGVHKNDFKKAIFIIDQAIKLDSNYLAAYSTKFSFLGMIRPYDKDKALNTLQNMIRIRPTIPEFYLYSGIIYIEKGDSLMADKYLSLAKVYIDKILDTMSKSNIAYQVLLSDKAYTLILKGEEEKARAMETEILELKMDSLYRAEFLGFLRKSRKEIIDSLLKQDM